LGEFKDTWPDLGTAKSVLECNGKVIDEAKAPTYSRQPVRTVCAGWPTTWAQGAETLEEGEIVLTGSWVTTRFPESRGHISLHDDGGVARWKSR